jgi:phosphoribosylamine--glycine ligase
VSTSTHDKQHILVVGNGAREHAIAWKLMQSPRVAKVSVAPGNGGTPNNVPIAATDIAGLVKWAQENKPDLTVIGPEAPLVAGIVDAFQAAGLRVFGPSKAAAQIEGSKVFAKQFMQRHNIPTAPFEVFNDPRKALGYLLTEGDQLLAIKADGLAAGKGVYVTDCAHDAEQAVQDLMVKRTMGEAGSQIVVETGLEGYEVSVLAFSDGEHVSTMPMMQDHKRIFDGDKGPNTGGMGVVSFYFKHLQNALDVIKHTTEAAIHGMAEDGIPFVGVLFTGVMVSHSGFHVLEYNARFGDPETQVILPMLDVDLLDVFEACLDGTLDKVQLNRRTAPYGATVVMASGGYPGDYVTGKPITGLDNVPDDVLVFHAGTKREDDQIVTAGGRVLSVTGLGGDLQTALDRAYAGINAINFEGAQFRTDIGQKVLVGTTQ